MVARDRYLKKNILEDLAERMVFLGGPRQVGKTTLALALIAKRWPSSYYNWDKLEERKKALGGQWPPESKLIILDEFHKYPRWKSWIKGEYDTLKNRYRFLLTGSARLNIYRRGSDSLRGRYHYCTLHPFSLAEIHSRLRPADPGTELFFDDAARGSDLELLLRFGGFPEPFIRQDSRFLRRWHNESMELFFKEDVRELTMIKDFGTLAILSDLLPERASSILSIHSLSQDLQVNFRTAAHWLDVFEHFYYCFRIAPFQTSKIAAVRKEKKLYMWDWSQVRDEGSRFENLVASHLLKFCHFLFEVMGWKAELFYIRDSSGRETDFLVCNDRRPWFAVEAKHHERSVSRNLLYFKERLDIPYCYQVARDMRDDFMKHGVRVMPASRFLTALV